MAEDYITICTTCSKGVTRENLKYESGLAFHPECFEQNGSKFPPIDPDLTNNTLRLKIQLIQLKNLKIRNNGLSNKSPSLKKKSTRNTKEKTKSRKISRKKKTRPTKRRVSRKRTVRKR